MSVSASYQSQVSFPKLSQRHAALTFSWFYMTGMLAFRRMRPSLQTQLNSLPLEDSVICDTIQAP